MRTVICGKLVTGDEIIATEIGDGLFEKVRVMQVIPTETGVGAGLVPFMMTHQDGKMLIDSTRFVTKVEAASDIERAYLQQTSGITLASTLLG